MEIKEDIGEKILEKLGELSKIMDDLIEKNGRKELTNSCNGRDQIHE